MSYPCPRCQAALAEVELLDVEIMRCEAQGCGLIVARNKMIPLTEAIARESLGCIDPHLPIQHAPHEPDRVANCPGCHQAMQQFGYLESNYAYLDRCEACEVIWIDQACLETVVRLAARTMGQRQTHDQQRDQLASELSRLVWINSTDNRNFLLNTFMM